MEIKRETQKKKKKTELVFIPQGLYYRDVHNVCQITIRLSVVRKALAAPSHGMAGKAGRGRSRASPPRVTSVCLLTLPPPSSR